MSPRRVLTFLLAITVAVSIAASDASAVNGGENEVSVTASDFMVRAAQSAEQLAARFTSEVEEEEDAEPSPSEEGDEDSEWVATTDGALTVSPTDTVVEATPDVQEDRGILVDGQVLEQNPDDSASDDKTEGADDDLSGTATGPASSGAAVVGIVAAILLPSIMLLVYIQRRRRSRSGFVTVANPSEDMQYYNTTPVHVQSV